jgi:RNA polymerase sigma-70 factor (sigma-E family)
MAQTSPEANDTVGTVGATLDFDALYADQWWPMLRLATSLVDTLAAAEDVTQDAFSGLYRRRETIREPRAAISYLRVSVVNGARSVLRKRRTIRKHLSLVRPENDHSADHDALAAAEQEAVRVALLRLPARHREVLSLRFLADLSDAEIAEATGRSTGGVRSASSRGLAALRLALGDQL